MKVLVYSSKDFEIPFLKTANAGIHAVTYISERLTTHTAMMAVGYDAISIFSADDASSVVLEKLKAFGVKYITLRSAGYDNVNLVTATSFKIQVANAPDYSPNAIAEHAVTLLMALNRKITLSRKQMQHYDFRLTNLIGFNLEGKTIGVIGAGKIGSVIIRIMEGFGCKILASDPYQDESLKEKYNVRFCDVETLCRDSDVIFLSVPLNTETHQLIGKKALDVMKKGAILVNVARGAVVHTEEVLAFIDNNHLGGYATDVYDKEKGVFSYDRSSDIPEDTMLTTLLNHDQIIMTPHQAYATHEALERIATTTVQNLTSWQAGQAPKTLLNK